MGKTVPQSYYVPELDSNIKVEFVSVNKYVANYPAGSERVKEADMKQGRWKHNGPWKDETLKDEVIALLIKFTEEVDIEAVKNGWTHVHFKSEDLLFKVKEMLK
jgi:hypothetical protein